MITKDQAIALNHRDELHFKECRVSMGEHGGITIQQVLARVNGKTKTWKRAPERFEVPIKHGMYETGYVNETNCELFHVASECPLRTDPFLKLITTPVIGDAFNDMALLTGLPQYYMDSRNDMASRIMAVRRHDYVMGIRPPRVPGEDLLKDAVQGIFRDTFDKSLSATLDHFPHIDPVEVLK